MGQRKVLRMNYILTKLPLDHPFGLTIISPSRRPRRNTGKRFSFPWVLVSGHFCRGYGDAPTGLQARLSLQEGSS